MDGRTRFYILVAVIVCAIALFLGSRDGEKKKEPKPEQKQAQTTKKVYEYEENASPIDENQGGVSQDVNFTPEELQQTQTIAIEFVKAYHNFDATQPLQNIENSKLFISQDLYDQLKNKAGRGTLDAVKKTWIEVHVTQTANPSKKKIIWNVVVQSENTNNDGVKELGEDWYLVQLEKENDQYKVTGVDVNAPI